MNILLIHITFAYLSLTLLLIKGVLSAKQIDWRQYKILKIAPHLIDTLLILTGVIFFIVIGSPWNESWIWSKFLFIGLYVIFAAKAFSKKTPFSLKHFLLAVISFMLAMFIAVMH